MYVHVYTYMTCTISLDVTHYKDCSNYVCRIIFYRLSLSLSNSRQSRLLTQQIAEAHTLCHAQRLRQSFSDALTGVRQALVTAKRPTTQQVTPLNTHCTTLYASIKTGLESSLGQLKVCCILVLCIEEVILSRTPDVHRTACIALHIVNECSPVPSGIY